LIKYQDKTKRICYYFFCHKVGRR